MAWREANALRDILGLSGNAALHRWIEPVANETRVQRAVTEAAAVRPYTELRYGARSWRCQRRVGTRVEATSKGLDIRHATW